MTLQDNEGRAARVTTEQRVQTVAVARSELLQNAIARGWAFTMTDDTVTPTAAGDYFVKIANTTTDPLVIQFIELENAGAEAITLVTSANYTSTGTHGEREPVNMLIGNTQLASSKGQFESDVDITGQPGTTNKLRVVNVSAGVRETIANQDGAPLCVLGANQALSFLASAGGNAISYSVVMYFAMEPVTTS